MYVYHRDIPNNQWNVYEIVNKEHEVYICSYPTAEKAKSFCDLMNKNIQLEAEIQAKLGE